MTYCAINAKLITFSFKYTHTERGELLGVGLLCATNDKVQMEKHMYLVYFANPKLDFGGHLEF